MNSAKIKFNILKIWLNANRKKFLASVVLLTTIFSAGWYLLPTGTLATGFTSQNPRFNIFTPYAHTQTYNQDYYLLDMKNDTKNTSWNDPISADAGDILTFSVYYHNGVNDTIARNTTLKVTIPSTTGTQIVSTGYLWASNADNATYDNPLTETGIINISTPQKLEYISGSAKWYPNQADWRLDAPTSFLFGQTGDEIIGSGVNIGDVNITNATNYAESVVANPRQRLSFQITVTSNGDVDTKNVVVKDILPDRLLYITGSTRIDTATALPDRITSYGGINIGDIPKGTSKIITFEVDIEREAMFVRGDTSLTNVAYVRADNLSEISDPAGIIVHYNGCSQQSASNVPGNR
ncbi:MAG: DUF11 domain-containing protein [Candidatus Portnoybacteria bacterium]|nr:DUF11 domain-containing protein [Candidatus Portnoybacteria bacterium]